MFLPIYLASLLISAGILGSVGQRLLATQGFVPDLQISLTVTLAIAAAYTGLQLAYYGLVRLLTPAKSQASLLAEAVAHATALVLVPFLLGVKIPWPMDILFKLELLIYLGAFLGLHGAFKLFAFFIALQGQQGNRLTSLLWFGAAYVCFLFSLHNVSVWQATLDSTHRAAHAESAVAQIGETYVVARTIREGAEAEISIDAAEHQDAVFYWAAPESAQDVPETVFVSLKPASGGVPVLGEVRLASASWASLRVRSEDMPEDAGPWQISWTSEAEPAWVSRSGFRPVSRSDRELLLSGPHLQAERATRSTPSIVLILVDGLAMAHSEAAGYPREIMTNLEAWGDRGIQYRHAFTNAPEPSAAAMSIFTGRDPLAHGYLGNFQGPLPETVRTVPEILAKQGYATAAFSEGEPPAGIRPYQRDLTYTSPFGRGFDVFDASFPLANFGAQDSNRPSEPVYGGAEQTLTKAGHWIEEQDGARHFTFIRLRELEQLLPLARYGPPRSNDPVDIYDQAVIHLDIVLSGFIDKIKLLPGGDNTAVILTSSYGYDFSGGAGSPGVINLSEQAVWVPLYLNIPGESARTRRNLVSLDDLGPTLLNLAGTVFPQPVTGVDILKYTSDRERISMTGSPLSLSLRNTRWRFTWYSGRTPFSNEVQTADQVVEMINIERLRYGRAQEDYLRDEPSLVADYKKLLLDYMLREDSPDGTVDNN